MSLIALLISFILTHVSASAAAHKFITTESKTFAIDKVYAEMAGPAAQHLISFLSQEEPGKLLWITGMKTEVVNRDTQQSMPVSYLCHNDIIVGENKNLFANRGGRLATLGSGRMNVNFPKNFAFPVSSNENIQFIEMISNPDPVDQPLHLAVKSRIDYMADDPSVHVRPLMARVASLSVPATTTASGHCEGEAGAPLEAAEPATGASARIWTAKDGKKMTHHWLVPPGRHEYRYKVGRLGLPYGSTLHYAAVHLHAYGSYVALRNLTTGKTIFKIAAKTDKSTGIIKEATVFSSESGVFVEKGHEFEIISGYNNTSKQKVHAMAIAYLYFEDKSFDRDLFSKRLSMAD